MEKTMTKTKNKNHLLDIKLGFFYCAVETNVSLRMSHKFPFRGHPSSIFNRTISSYDIILADKMHKKN